jgi:hypothetical protein
MSSGGDKKYEEATDAQDLFAYRYWYTWETAKNWPKGSVVLIRYRADRKWFYHLENNFEPLATVIFADEYLLIERNQTNREFQ